MARSSMPPSPHHVVCSALFALSLLAVGSGEQCSEDHGPSCAKPLDEGEESGLLQVQKLDGAAAIGSPLKSSMVADGAGGSCVVPPGMRVAKMGAGFNMVLLGDDDVVSHYLSHAGWWEIGQPSDLAGPEATLPSSGTFLDIGGNIGYYSLLFAHAGYKVLTVEPMTRNRAALEASLCLNPQLRDRITIFPVALASPDQQSMKCIIKPQNAQNVGDGTMACGTQESVGPCDSAAGCETVPVKTLDSLLAEVNPDEVNMVKMDIEGFECKALAGGQSLFQRFQPQVFRMESKMSGSACLEQVAATYGYRVVPKDVDTLIVKKV